MFVGGLLLLSAASVFADTFTVTNTANSGAGSLRAAITNANAHPNISAEHPDVIAFNIAGAGVHRIAPTTYLPAIIDPVVIDGYTQPGASPNTQAKADDAVLLIELNGDKFGSAGAGLIVEKSATVRGLVLNGWTSAAITVKRATTGPVVIEGNFIGTDATGTSAKPNQNAIAVGDSSDVTIGAVTPAARNIISGNAAGGAAGGISITNSSATIQGNFIGVDASGSAALPNDAGVAIDCFHSETLVGGAGPGAGNVISGNSDGILTYAGANAKHPTEIVGNRIGVAAATLDAVPNNYGVHLLSPAGIVSDVRIGLLQQGTKSRRVANVIAHNKLAGVWVEKTGGVTITANQIFGNHLGIDLGDDGAVTPNDAGDGDTGANSLQNFPVITSATTFNGTVTVLGNLDSKPNRSYRLEFFGNPTADSSGYGEGRWFFGAGNVTTDAAGHASFNFSYPNHHPAAKWAAATATNPAGETSEFSLDRKIFNQPPPP